MKRLTARQKQCGILTVLFETKYPLTPHAIGRALGLANGQPLKGALADLERSGLVAGQQGEYMGKPATWFLLTPHGRQETAPYVGDGRGLLEEPGTRRNPPPG